VDVRPKVREEFLPSRRVVTLDEDWPGWWEDWSEKENVPVEPRSLVRMCPPAGMSPEAAACVVGAVRSVAGVSVKVQRRAVAAALPAELEREDKPARTVREVVWELVESATKGGGEPLRAVVRELMDEVGL